MPRFEVVPYKINTLRTILTRFSKASEEAIEQSPHYFYTQTYFPEIGAKTILVEPDYVDRDYLEDYAGYYVSCFKEYKRHCTRVHFFSNEFKKDDFEKLLGSRDGRLSVDDLQENYLGFTVIKNLPKTIIGRTCLKTYSELSSTNGKRGYPITRDYETNIFGIRLTVKSIAFQEQDSVVAACATSALWSAFQGTGKLFQHQIPSPVEITKAATRQIPHETRAFPSSGLTLEQMADAIRYVGLEPFLIDPQQNPYMFKAGLYAYLKGKIPVLFGIALHDVSSNPLYRYDTSRHAVALTGYHLSSQDIVKYPGTQFSCKAFAVDKVYVHDDQVGPFARMEIDTQPVDGIPWTLSTSWRGGDGRIGNVRAVPWIFMVPLYHKIRISFSSVYYAVYCFHERVIETLKSAEVVTFPGEIEWDIYLITVNDFKTQIFSSDKLGQEVRLDVLMRAMPRFLWRATATCMSNTIMDLLFDATDIEQDQFLAHAIICNHGLRDLLTEISSNPRLLNISKTDPEWKVLGWFSPEA
ncbi:MAG TPA: hypothetical protein PLM29_00500 [Deltaproteobacteria bacterium]|nr:hypothetical protein [Deltaproteobacteria bacterium]